jgi:exodeoxyribonuclease V alpha subunit
MEELEGVLERIIYEAEETGYTVARFRSPTFKEELTVVGNLLACSPGEHLLLRGRWTEHPKYGRQFQIEEYRTTTPATVAGIRKYLGSGLIKGIGPVLAERITDHFGLETLKIIEEEPQRLSEVEGIGQVRVERILQAWAEQKEIREVMLFLKAHDVSTAYAAKIYKTYGNRAIRVVKENPYRLAEEIHGIGFVTADRIAADLGVPRDAPQRMKAGILYVLSEAADREGHVYLPRSELLDRCARILEGAERAGIEAALAAAAAARQVFVEERAAEPEPAVYLAPFHTAERGLARCLRELLAAPSPLSKRPSALAQAERLLAQITRETPYSERQLQAIRAVLTHKLIILTGGPGTGKTTTVQGILRLLEGLGLTVRLAAPTGRAAKRLSEATGRPAQTLHRLLEYSPKEGFGRDEERPLKLDALVVDELSMVDLLLMYHLVKALPPSTVLILVGDVDQLPAVGAGNVLRDLIASVARGTACRARTIELTEIFRQARRSLIVTNAHRINGGEFPEITPRREGDFFFLEAEEPEEAARTIEELVTKRLPARYGFDPIEEIQVLSPMYRGAAGVEALNRALQERLNPARDASAALRYGGRAFRIEDKVMQIHNDYEKEVFNGDIGRVAAADPSEGQLVVRFPGRGEVVYQLADLSDLVIAYAITVHKSQGSEYRAVVLPWLSQHYIMLQRNLLYTAVTRAKELVVIVGTKKALGIALRNDVQARRYSGLAEKLLVTA